MASNFFSVTHHTSEPAIPWDLHQLDAFRVVRRPPNLVTHCFSYAKRKISEKMRGMRIIPKKIMIKCIKSLQFK